MNTLYLATGGDIVRYVAIGKLDRNVYLQWQGDNWITVNPIDAPEFFAAGSTFSSNFYHCPLLVCRG